MPLPYKTKRPPKVTISARISVSLCKRLEALVVPEARPMSMVIEELIRLGLNEYARLDEQQIEMEIERAATLEKMKGGTNGDGPGG